MPEPDYAIRFENVGKSYRLYPSRMEMALDVTGLRKLLRLKSVKYPEHHALSNINLTIGKGAQVGIIGRNGAGKSTLLKLITENFRPTRGAVHVSGKVQALLSAGVGFHPDLTGAENIRAALIYNGLSQEEVGIAYDDVVDFSELDEYLYQPFRTYSLGMQSRLMFATATAIKPQILVIDEVLGAGDAYFAAKSAERMEQLTSSGATLLVVSHSMEQIVKFSKMVVWLERGEVAMQGEALEVVKAYERFIRMLDEERLQTRNRSRAGATTSHAELLARVRSEAAANIDLASGRTLSRWQGVEGLRIESFRLTDAALAERAVFDSGEMLRYEVSIRNESESALPCVVAVNTYALDGRQVLLDWSPTFDAPPGISVLGLAYDPLVLGNGEYVVSIGLYAQLDMRDHSTALYHDIWDRSFQFKVVTPYKLDASVCKPPHRWELPA